MYTPSIKYFRIEVSLKSVVSCVKILSLGYFELDPECKLSRYKGFVLLN